MLAGVGERFSNIYIMVVIFERFLKLADELNKLAQFF